MLDNLRSQASFDEEETPPEVVEPQPEAPRPRRTLDQITGMNAKQRFFLAVMLFIMVCLIGSMFLLVLEKVVPPM